MAETDTVLALAAEIERRDGEVAQSLELVNDLSRRASAIRGRATELGTLLVSVPGELAALERSAAHDRDARAAAAAELAGAEQEATTAKKARRMSDDERSDAARRVDNARERLEEIEARIARRTAEHEALGAIELDARRDALELADAAAAVAASLDDVPRISQSGRDEPEPGLSGIEEWGGRVHAALFVVRGQLEGERDRIVREANELGGAVLGEQLAGASVALVRRRLEEALRG